MKFQICPSIELFSRDYVSGLKISFKAVHVNFRTIKKGNDQNKSVFLGRSSSDTIYLASYIDKKPQLTGYYLISRAFYLRNLNLLISKTSKNLDVLYYHNPRKVDHYQRMFVNYLYFVTVHNYCTINQHTFLWLWQFNCCFQVPKYVLSFFLFFWSESDVTLADGFYDFIA